MRRLVLFCCVLIGVSLSGGCLSPATRLPTLWPRHPAVEKLSYEYHDPYPDRNVGPDVDQRPRGFNQQRTEPRRAVDLRAVHLGGPQPGEPPSQPPPLGMKYPDVVDP